MPRPLDTRLDRQEGRRTAGTAEQVSAEIRQRGIWRAEAAIGAASAARWRTSASTAQATRLCLADEAAAALAMLPDTPELQRVDSDAPAAAEDQDRVRGDDFELKIRAIAQSFADAPPTNFTERLVRRAVCLVARPVGSAIARNAAASTRVFASVGGSDGMLTIAEAQRRTE